MKVSIFQHSNDIDLFMLTSANFPNRSILKAMFAVFLFVCLLFFLKFLEDTDTPVCGVISSAS